MAHQLEIRCRHWGHSHIRGCCATSTCFKNFLDLDDHLISVTPHLICELMHEDCSGNFMPTMPDTFKYHNFLIDLMEFRMQHYFNNDDYTCNLDVNMQGHNKVYAAWRVLDQYRGRWGCCSVKRNVVDIIVNVPEWNIQIDHHFCFRYFNQSWGSPETLIPHIMKRVVALFYDKYYTDNMITNITTRKHYLCQNCDYTIDEGPSNNLKESIPEWFYMATYDDQNLPQVSDSLLLFFLLWNKM